MSRCRSAKYLTAELKVTKLLLLTSGARVISFTGWARSTRAVVLIISAGQHSGVTPLEANNVRIDIVPYCALNLFVELERRRLAGYLVQPDTSALPRIPSLCCSHSRSFGLFPTRLFIFLCTVLYS
jgi:hypothetical protein